MNECDPLPPLVSSGIRQFFSGFSNSQGGSNINTGVNGYNAIGSQFIQLKEESDFL